MSERASEAALKAYPYQRAIHFPDGFQEFDRNSVPRTLFQEGYEEAEKDIISLIESRISKILGDAQPKPALRAELQELIKHIKEEQK